MCCDMSPCINNWVDSYFHAGFQRPLHIYTKTTPSLSSDSSCEPLHPPRLKSVVVVCSKLDEPRPSTVSSSDNKLQVHPESVSVTPASTAVATSSDAFPDPNPCHAHSPDNSLPSLPISLASAASENAEPQVTMATTALCEVQGGIHENLKINKSGDI